MDEQEEIRKTLKIAFNVFKVICILVAIFLLIAIATI